MKQQRYPGLDRLRILAAYFVVGIHLFALIGGLDSGAGLLSLANLLVYALVFCAVNCFGLLSGYLGYREEGNGLRIAPLLLLWLQFVFYRVFFLLVPSLMGLCAPVSLTDVFLPLTKRVNWYMSAYFEMMLLAPALNLVIRHSSRGANAVMCAVLFLISVFSTLLRAVLDCDPFLLGEGYNWMWLAVLYFWGASVRRHGWLQAMPRRTLWAALVCALTLTAGWRFLMHGFFSPAAFPGSTGKLFYSYPSPTIAVAALCLLLLHARAGSLGKWDAGFKKASSAALGVFLLHTTVWGWLIAPAAGLLSPLPREWAFVNVLLSALVITALCIPVDLLRGWLFEKFGLRRLADRAQGIIFALCARLVSPK